MLRITSITTNNRLAQPLTFCFNKRLYRNPYLYQSRNIAEGFVSLLCTCVILSYGNHLIDCQIVGKSGECDVVTTSTHLWSSSWLFYQWDDKRAKPFNYHLRKVRGSPFLVVISSPASFVLWNGIGLAGIWNSSFGLTFSMIGAFEI